MASRDSEGAALLVAGHGSPNPQALGEIGEVLLASATPWRIRRPIAAGRASIKQHIDELSAGETGVSLLIVTGQIASIAGAPALVTGPLFREYPDDTTLPLAWIRERLTAARAERLLVALSAHGDGTAAGWLAALATGRPAHVIAVDEDPQATRLLHAIAAGLCGEALDGRTGTVTMRSLSEQLARRLPEAALQPSLASETLTSVPPLGERWALRQSRAATMRSEPAVAAASSADGVSLEGTVLPGQFRVERELARGSFGIVYRARQLSVDRDVAVKVLHPNVDTRSEDARLFVQEIQSVGRIDHVNVVRIHQADATLDGRLFFAMELLVGRDLQQMFADEGPLEPSRAVALVRQLLAGLTAVHAAGLVHADLKPANAFVVAGADERVVLLDFGLARLRPAADAAEAAGGTPAYMAPEQLHNGRVDARSDLFSTALVLVTLLTGWQRRRAADLVPPLDAIQDAALREVLARALAMDPDQRYPTAEAFSDALAGKAPGMTRVPGARAPFHHLAPFTERDRARLHGRDDDVAALTEQILYRRAVIYTAPSGVGKTSLLRAGLVPRLEALGAHPVYVVCRGGTADSALTIDHQRGGKTVLILDQLETALGEDDPDVIASALAFDRHPAGADTSVVLCVREDHLARVAARAQRLHEGIPILRLGPLDTAGARAAIVTPLAEQRLSMTPELLEVLLADLRAAAASLGNEMGWGTRDAVYPPHLQLACAVLYEALPSREAVITLEHYRRLGGLDAIVGEHLDRVLDGELDTDAAAAARDLFLALVTGHHTRAFRPEAELMELAAPRHGVERVRGVLEALRARGLLVRVRPSTGEPGWELVHDSLVPRVLAWIDRRDLARRRAVELVRYHLRRSRPEAPSLLNRAELREIRDHRDAVAELDEEWRRRTSAGDLTPGQLVDSSRRAVRRVRLAVAAAVVAVLTLAGAVTARIVADREERALERSRRDRDLGLFAVELRPFDWDPLALRATEVPAAELPALAWTLHEPADDDAASPGPPVQPHLFARRRREGGVEHIEARGGDAFLVITGRGRPGEDCAPSILPLRGLPGYGRRAAAEPIYRLSVPTCATSSAGMVEVPSGPYIRGGLGEPPSALKARHPELIDESIVALPGFLIDRTEVSNRAFAIFAAMSHATGIPMPAYPGTPGLEEAYGDRHPVSGITWLEARAYCRFLGRTLPTPNQWEKAMRGGLALGDGRPNPMPRRNLPWGTTVSPTFARINTGEVSGATEVGATQGDVSPYGVLDLAGNVHEWVESEPTTPATFPMRGFRPTKGGNWGETTPDLLVDYMAITNPRAEGMRTYVLGTRCALLP